MGAMTRHGDAQATWIRSERRRFAIASERMHDDHRLPLQSLQLVRGPDRYARRARKPRRDRTCLLHVRRQDGDIVGMKGVSGAGVIDHRAVLQERVHT